MAYDINWVTCNLNRITFNKIRITYDINRITILFKSNYILYKSNYMWTKPMSSARKSQDLRDIGKTSSNFLCLTQDIRKTPTNVKVQCKTYARQRKKKARHHVLHSSCIVLAFFLRSQNSFVVVKFPPSAKNSWLMLTDLN